MSSYRYVKMQERALTSSEGALQFDVVVPKTTSTRHVAAAAFYHCLGITFFSSEKDAFPC